MGPFIFIISIAIVIVIIYYAVKHSKEYEDVSPDPQTPTTSFQKRFLASESKEPPQPSHPDKTIIEKTQQSQQKQIQSSNKIDRPKSAQTKDGFTVLEGYTVGKDSLIFEIAGISYKTKELAKISFETPDWKLSDEELLKKYGNSVTIYKHSHILTPVKLIPEPKNQHDPNAIKVVVAGQHIGYVPADHTAVVRRKMNENNGYYNAECFITDAEWKRIYHNEVRLHKDKYIEGWILLL